MDNILITDLHLVLKNEGEFYHQARKPLEVAASKFWKKNNYEAARYVNALQERIRDFLKNGDKTCSYHGFKASKQTRIEVAKLFEIELFNELKIGNFTEQRTA